MTRILVNYGFGAHTKGKVMSKVNIAKVEYEYPEYEYEWLLEEHEYHSKSYDGKEFVPACSDIEITHAFAASKSFGRDHDEFQTMMRWLNDWHYGEPSEQWVPAIKGSTGVTGYEISLVCAKYENGKLINKGHAYVDQSSWTLDIHFVDARNRRLDRVPLHHFNVIHRAMRIYFSVFRNLSNAYILREQNGHTHKMIELNQPALADL